MAQARLRVAVIGTGMIANAGHIPAWKALSDDVEIVAVSDQWQERAELVAKTEGIAREFADWRKMLAEVRPDVVSVCTPNAHHREPTVAALQGGAHVLCEKPAATGAADAAAMFEARRSDRLLLIGQTQRFVARSQAVKRVVEAGRLGEIYYAETVCMRRRGIPTWGQFHMKAHSGGGPIYDLGVHAIDLLYWLMGSPPVQAVSAATYTKFGNRDEKLATSLAESGAPLGVLTPRPFDRAEFDVEDMASGYIRLAGGITVTVKTSWAANIPKGMFQTTILGTEGGLQLEPLTLATNQDGYQVEVTPSVPADRNVAFVGHWNETAHFVRAIRGHEELQVKEAEVLNVMKTLDALYESAKLGREVQVK